MATVGCWNNFPRDMAEFPLLEIFTMQLGSVPNNSTFPHKGSTWWPFEVPSNLGYSMILWFCDS